MLFVSLRAIDRWKEIPQEVDGIELRLDLIPSVDLKTLDRSLPLMFTLSGCLENKEERVKECLAVEPDYVDLPWDMSGEFLSEVIGNHPKTRFILSYHNHAHTPDDLELLLERMRRIPAYGYKIAALSHSANDALRMLLFSRKHPDVSAICMGEQGQFARILGPLVRNQIDYAALGDEFTAPGQLSIDELLSIYRYRTLNPETHLYGLIGNPVSHSQGHLHHNGVFAKAHWNAVYVKIALTEEELPSFFPLAQKMGFRGLSVTMPLKEKVLPFLDQIDPEVKAIGAVNTLLFEKGGIKGANTDGKGALDAIESRGNVQGKKMVVIGAGGTAKAIAFEAKKRGADLVILNRTIKRAEELALDLHCAFGGLSDLPNTYDLLINTSPESPLFDRILPSALVMDVVYTPRETPFLLQGKKGGSQVVYGEEMFENQANRQTLLWSVSC
jgi:3-dehydroquinate dehydratase/shikimate dehydrogenase